MLIAGGGVLGALLIAGALLYKRHLDNNVRHVGHADMEEWKLLAETQ